LYVVSLAGDAGRVTKIAFEIDFLTWKPRRPVNLARTAFKINPQILGDRKRYRKME
jgi:hypothetical protein